ncbi:MAG: glycosyltransferase [Acidiferrobacterales bacterium]|nr:glycosyltransferase [Acidiferrobacterales bacterium]
MKQTGRKMSGNRNNSENHSEQDRKLHVAFVIDSMDGGGAELSVLTVIDSLLHKNHKIDLVLFKFRGKRLSQIPDGVNLFVLGQEFQQGHQNERCSIPIDEIHWIRLPTGFKETINGLLSYFRSLKIKKKFLPPRRRHFYRVHSMSEYLKSQTPNLIVANSFPSCNISVLGRKLSFTDVPVVCSIRIDCLHSLDRKNRIYFNSLISYVQKIHSISQGLTDSVEKYMEANNLQAGQKGITTIYNGFNVERILSLSGLPVQHDWFTGGGQFSDDVKTILAVGRLHYQKNFELLINAFSIVLKESDTRLIILGQGERRGKLENLVQELNIRHAVSMPGWVDNPYAFMARANLFVSTSNTEGFHRGIAEAVICGCPVVSTDCPSGPSEILEGGIWGRLTPVNDQDALVTAILESLNTETDRGALQVRGKKFDINSIIQDYEELFHAVVDEFKSNP